MSKLLTLVIWVVAIAVFIVATVLILLFWTAVELALFAVLRFIAVHVASSYGWVALSCLLSLIAFAIGHPVEGTGERWLHTDRSSRVAARVSNATSIVVLLAGIFTTPIFPNTWRPLILPIAAFVLLVGILTVIVTWRSGRERYISQDDLLREYLDSVAEERSRVKKSGKSTAVAPATKRPSPANTRIARTPKAKKTTASRTSGIEAPPQPRRHRLVGALPYIGVSCGLVICIDAVGRDWFTPNSNATVFGTLGTPDGAYVGWGWLFTAATILLVLLAATQVAALFVPRAQLLPKRQFGLGNAVGGAIMLLGVVLTTVAHTPGWILDRGWWTALAAAGLLLVSGVALAFWPTRLSPVALDDRSTESRRTQLLQLVASRHALTLLFLLPFLGTPLTLVELVVRRYPFPPLPFPGNWWLFVIPWLGGAAVLVAPRLIPKFKEWRRAAGVQWVALVATGLLMFLIGAVYTGRHWADSLGNVSFGFRAGWLIALASALGIAVTGAVRGLAFAPQPVVETASIGATRAAEAASALPEQSIQRAREAREYVETQIKSVDWLFTIKAVSRYPWATFAALLSSWSGIAYAFWIACLAAVFNGITFAQHGYSFAQAHSFWGVLAKEFAVFSGFVGAISIGAGTFANIYGGQWAHAGLAILTLMAGGVIASYTLVILGMIFEGFMLQLRGYRRLSTREQNLAYPIYDEVARAMSLTSVPPLLISEHKLIGAWTHTRHIVITRAFFTPDSLELAIDRDQLAAILCHEVEHWRRGDPIALGFSQACALPVAVMLQIAEFAIWLAFFLFPFEILARLFIAPILGRESRTYEYQADAAAVRAGYGRALIDALVTIRVLEPGRTGWERVVCGSHPPTELRIQAIEEEEAAIAAGGTMLSAQPPA